MKALSYMVLLAGMMLRCGPGASLAGAQPQGALPDAVSTAPSPAAPALDPGPVGATAITKDKEPPTFLRDVLPIFMGKCVRCHNSEAKLMYNWLDYKTAFGDRWEIRKRVWNSWKGSYYKQPMPAGNSAELRAMTEEERMTIKLWVESGAPYGVLSANASLKSKAERIEFGKRLFTTICASCHQPTGQGIPSQFPPLAGSDFLNADKTRAIKVLLKGLQGEVVVNGRKFNNSMPSIPLGDDDIASALTYVYNSFGNSGKEVTPEEVKGLREANGEVAGTEPKKGANTPRELSAWE